MTPKNLAIVLTAFTAAFGLSFIVTYLVTRVYLENMQVIYLVKPEHSEDGPAPADISALLEEARRIIKEAGGE